MITDVHTISNAYIVSVKQCAGTWVSVVISRCLCFCIEILLTYACLQGLSCIFPLLVQNEELLEFRNCCELWEILIIKLYDQWLSGSFLLHLRWCSSVQWHAFLALSLDNFGFSNTFCRNYAWIHIDGYGVTMPLSFTKVIWKNLKRIVPWFRCLMMSFVFHRRW
jgi:hypothetical protein